jgi:hypothetical protein
LKSCIETGKLDPLIKNILKEAKYYLKQHNIFVFDSLGYRVLGKVLWDSFMSYIFEDENFNKKLLIQKMKIYKFHIILVI